MSRTVREILAELTQVEDGIRRLGFQTHQTSGLGAPGATWASGEDAERAVLERRSAALVEELRLAKTVDDQSDAGPAGEPPTS